MEPEALLLGLLAKMNFDQFISISVKLFFIYMIISAAKQFLNTAFNYFMVRINTLGIGSTVEYAGHVAKIKDIQFSKIVLENDDRIIYVSIDDWRKVDIIIPKK